MEHRAPKVSQDLFSIMRETGIEKAPVRECRFVRADKPRKKRVIDANFANEPNTLLCLDDAASLQFNDVALAEGVAGPSRTLLKFGLFFFAEYTHMITTSFLLSILFFGGWHFPGIATPESGVVIKLIVIGVKMSLFILFFMMVRWSIPRFCSARR